MQCERSTASDSQTETAFGLIGAGCYLFGYWVVFGAVLFLK